MENFFILYLFVTSSVTADLKCYVCTDCEFNYKSTATICEDTRLPESVETTETTITDNEITVTYQTTDSTQTTDSSSTEETAYTEVPEKTTIISTIITTDKNTDSIFGDTTTSRESSIPESATKPLPNEKEKPSIIDEAITEAISTERYTSSDYTLSTVSSEAITDLHMPEISVTTSLLTITEPLYVTTLSSTMKASSQTESLGTILPSSTASLESQDFSPTTSTSNLDTLTISNEENTVTIDEGSKGDVRTTQFPNKTEISSTQVYTETDSATNSASYKTTTSDTVAGEYETTVLFSSTIDAVSITTEATSTSSQTEGSPTSSTDASIIEEFSTTESTTNTILDSTEEHNLQDNKPNVVMVDETKLYGPRQRFIRAIQTKEDTGRKPRCIVTAYEEQNKTIIVRGCSFTRKQEENCSSLENGLKSTKCFVCDTDLCNSSTTAVASAFVLIVTIFSALAEIVY